MKILWASNFSAMSAYAQQSNMIVPRLRDMGHEVMVFELSNGSRRPYDWEGITILQPAHDPLGNDIIEYYVNKYGIEAVITLVDVWRFDSRIWGKLPWYPFTPIDHKPIPPAVLERLKVARKPIAMTRFGAEEMQKAGFDPLYMPHMVDTSIFHPRTAEQRAAIRKAMNIPQDAFFAAFVGVNDSTPNRKGIPEMLAAWKQHLNKYPDSVLYLHTLANGNLPINSIGGVKIEPLITSLSIPRDSIRIVDQQRYQEGMIDQRELADIYAAADVFLLMTRGEGFGVPLVESQACGTPVITTDFAGGSAVSHAGWRVQWEMEWSFQDTWRAKPGIMSAVEQLECAYHNARNPRLRELAVKEAQQYSIDNVMRNYVQPVIDAIGLDVLSRMTVGQAEGDAND